MRGMAARVHRRQGRGSANKTLSRTMGRAEVRYGRYFLPGVRNSSSGGGCVAWGRGESAGTGARGERGSREPGRREGSGGLGAGLCGFRQARSQPYLLVSATTFKA